MPNWQALVLGLVQGATELLPISSSGHLILVPWLFDWDYLEENDAFNQTFDVSLHLGTLVAVGAYFWHDLKGSSSRGSARCDGGSIATTDERIAWVVVAATIPAGVIGFLLEDFDRRAPGRAVADRDLPGGVRPAARLGRPAADDARRWTT